MIAVVGSAIRSAASACSRSAMMSSLSSSPIDSRTTSGPAPACTFCASDKLPVRGRGRMDDQRARVADIGEMREQLHVRDELDAGVVAALEAEGEHRARALRHVFLGEGVVAVAGEARIAHPGDLGMLRRAIRRPPCALSQWRCMRSGSVSMPVRIRKALNGESAGPDVAQAEHAAGDGEGEIAEGLVQHDAVIFRARLATASDSGPRATS